LFATLDEEINSREAVEDLIRKEADAPIYGKLGLNYGQAIRFKRAFSEIFPPSRPIATQTKNKPSMGKLESFSPELKRLYLTK